MDLRIRGRGLRWETGSFRSLFSHDIRTSRAQAENKAFVEPTGVIPGKWAQSPREAAGEPRLSCFLSEHVENPRRNSARKHRGMRASAGSAMTPTFCANDANVRRLPPFMRSESTSCSGLDLETELLFQAFQSFPGTLAPTLLPPPTTPPPTQAAGDCGKPRITSRKMKPTSHAEPQNIPFLLNVSSLEPRISQHPRLVPP